MSHALRQNHTYLPTFTRAHVRKEVYIAVPAHNFNQLQLIKSELRARAICSVVRAARDTDCTPRRPISASPVLLTRVFILLVLFLNPRHSLKPPAASEGTIRNPNSITPLSKINDGGRPGPSRYRSGPRSFIPGTAFCPGAYLKFESERRTNGRSAGLSSSPADSIFSRAFRLFSFGRASAGFGVPSTGEADDNNKAAAGRSTEGEGQKPSFPETGHLSACRRGLSRRGGRRSPRGVAYEAGARFYSPPRSNRTAPIR